MEKTKRIEQVINKFDFGKVHKIINVISEGNNDESVDDLKCSAIVALRDVTNNDKFESKEKGFIAKRNLNDVLTLSFDVTIKSVVQ